MPGVYCPRCKSNVILEQDGKRCSNCKTQLVIAVPPPQPHIRPPAPKRPQATEATPPRRPPPTTPPSRRAA